ncbi:hypothetical protein BC937DRAFT_87456 [Endogone sp. FLAS-F59071]|nr:hypothetical protein BC937DRAFT_87456 [Endogone sp. FLAS-F59071]|eukprot:RUS12595.1 hypothetical protein BC937DRAFT_87456 [Endogone sp. FLAS-F59071]
MPNKKKHRSKTTQRSRRARSASVTSHTPKEPANMSEDSDGGLPIGEEGKKMSEEDKEADEDKEARAKCVHIKSIKIKKIKAMLPHIKKEPKCPVGGLGWEDCICFVSGDWRAAVLRINRAPEVLLCQLYTPSSKTLIGISPPTQYQMCDKQPNSSKPFPKPSSTASSLTTANTAQSNGTTDVALPTSRSSLWMCLTCAQTSCGRTANQHALQHYEEKGTEHALAINLETFACWWVNQRGEE